MNIQHQKRTIFAAISLIAFGGLMMGAAHADHDHQDNQGRNVECKSNQYAFKSCPVRGVIKKATIRDRQSNSGCDLGYDWGYSRSAVWVTNGCKAEFDIQYGRANERYGRTGYETPIRRPDYNDHRFADSRYHNGRGYYHNGRYYQDRSYYGNRHGHGSYHSSHYNHRYSNWNGYENNQRARRAVDACVVKATRRLRRDGYNSARFDEVKRIRKKDGHWVVKMDFRIRRGDHETIKCHANQNGAHLVDYNFERREYGNHHDGRGNDQSHNNGHGNHNDGHGRGRGGRD